MNAAAVLTVLFLLVLVYIYFGYLQILKLLARFGKPEKSVLRPETTLPRKITVLLTVHNEEAVVLERIDNLLTQNYPPEFFEVLVASDGSTDQTDVLVSGVTDPRVRLFSPGMQRGKTATQNLALQTAEGELVVFTDAASRFDRDFLQNINKAFGDDAVGAADGHLLFDAQEENPLAQSQGYYWRYELALRSMESRMGILSVASGACLAVRKKLIREMNPAIGEDCIIPLDVVAQGYRVVHVPDAQAHDQMADAPEQEFRARVRMTLRNWQGTWSRPELLNVFRHPGFAFSLWSHKILRWLSPFFLMGLLVCSNWWAMNGGAGWMAAAAMNSFVALALAGWLSGRAGVRIPLAATAYSFMLVNAGFMLGVIRAVSGNSIFTYKES
jgi:cellulose synthase/poly-beta-1,6-N-acetylglucosamine synthase-like glycosyltransferase